MPPWLQSPVIASFSYNSNSSFSSVPMFHLLCSLSICHVFVWKYELAHTRLEILVKWDDKTDNFNKMVTLCE